MEGQREIRRDKNCNYFEELRLVYWTAVVKIVAYS